jgi:hypothetical protein
VTTPAPPFAALATIAVLQGLALLAYGVFDLVETVRVGVSGPADVSNVPAVVLQILLFVVFGGAMIWIGWGWWTARRWARSPFLLAQLIAAFVGVELAQSEGSVERYSGIGLCLVAVLGIVLVFTPQVMRTWE